MITRCVEIAGIGIFERLTGVRPEWKPLTLIYAENGRGKTTLAHVLRSAAEQSGESLERRRRLGSDAPEPDARLLLSDGQSLIYADGMWSGGRAVMRFFDRDFIRTHVHIEHSISPDNRRRLIELALGESAVEASLESRDLSEDVARLKLEHRSALAALDGDLGDLSFEEFTAIPKAADAEQGVRALERELEAIERSRLLDGLTMPQLPAPLPTQPDAELAAALAGAIDIDAAVHALVQEHIHTLDDTRAAGWLRTGTALSDGAHCPFCRQPVDAVAGVAALGTYFQGRVAAAVEELLAVRDRALDPWSEAAAERCISAWREASAQLDAWRFHLGAEEAPPLPEQRIRNAFAAISDGIRAAIDHKLASLASPMDTTALRTVHHAAVAALDEALAPSASSLQALVEAVVAFHHEHPVSSAESVTDALRLAQLAQRRHTPAVAERVEAVRSAHAALEAALTRLRAARQRVQQSLDSVFREFESEVNALLEDLGAPFRIHKLRSDHSGGHGPRGNYRIELLEQQVPVDGQHSRFDEALSEGDKRTLAFALFVATAQRAGDLSRSIIVIDDPMTSLDLARSSRTRHWILRLARNAEQVIVLAHDAVFLRALRDEASRSRGPSTAALRLHRSGPSSSTITTADLDDLCATTYRRNLQLLEKYVAQGLDAERGEQAIRAEASRVREVLEGYLHSRFPLDFESGMMLGAMSTRIRAALPDARIFGLQQIVDELDEIRSFGNAGHHDTDPLHRSQSPSDAEVTRYAQKTLDFVHRVR